MAPLRKRGHPFSHLQNPVQEAAGLGGGAGALNVSFIGGEQQFFLPGLMERDVTTEVFGVH